jgi:hypothetical protein
VGPALCDRSAHWNSAEPGYGGNSLGPNRPPAKCRACPTHCEADRASLCSSSPPDQTTVAAHGLADCTTPTFTTHPYPLPSLETRPISSSFLLSAKTDTKRSPALFSSSCASVTAASVSRQRPLPLSTFSSSLARLKTTLKSLATKRRPEASQTLSSMSTVSASH